jgi:ice-binding like protein
MKNLRDVKARSRRPLTTIVLLVALAALLPLAVAGNALGSSPNTVPLGTTDTFALFASSLISDVPTSTITGDVGLTPAAGSAITGLTCAEVTGTIYSVDATGPLPCRVTNSGALTTADNNLGTAYGDAAGRGPDLTFVGADNQLGGQVLVPGVYRFPHAATANLIGNLTLNGDASSVWIFQATSDFVTAGSSTVTITGGGQSCNVFWQVGSSATIGASSVLRGTVLANASISVGSSATIDGRLLAGAQAAGALTLISDTVTRPSTCLSAADIAAAVAASQAAAAAAAAAEAAAAQAAAAAQVAANLAAANTAALAAAAQKAAADAAKAAAKAKVAAAAAAKAAKAKNVAAAKAAAVKAATAARVAKAKATAARSIAAKIKARRAASSTSTTFAQPPIRHVGLTG